MMITHACRTFAIAIAALFIGSVLSGCVSETRVVLSTPPVAQACKGGEAGPAAYLSEPTVSQHITWVKHDGDVPRKITKFGGQPVWLAQPQWPVSKETGTLMEFVGQVALDPKLVPGGAGKMAYLFVTGDEGLLNNVNPPKHQTWDPDGGENAVIIQPNGIPTVATSAVATGPTVGSGYLDEGEDRRTVKESWTVALSRRTDPAFRPQGSWSTSSSSDADFEKYDRALVGDKIGGTPVFVQNDEFPACGVNILFLQLDGMPFGLNVGDGGAGFAYVNSDATIGKYLWQSH